MSRATVLDLVKCVKCNIHMTFSGIDCEFCIEKAPLQTSPKQPKFVAKPVIIDGAEFIITSEYNNCIVLNYTFIIAKADIAAKHGLSRMKIEEVTGCATKCMLIALFDAKPAVWAKFGITSPLDIYAQLVAMHDIDEGSMLDQTHLSLIQDMYSIKIGVQTKTEDGVQYGIEPKKDVDIVIVLKGNHYLNGSQL